MTPATTPLKPIQPTKGYAVFDNGVLVFETDYLSEAMKFLIERKSGTLYGRQLAEVKP